MARSDRGQPAKRDLNHAVVRCSPRDVSSAETDHGPTRPLSNPSSPLEHRTDHRAQTASQAQTYLGDPPTAEVGTPCPGLSPLQLRHRRQAAISSILQSAV